MSSWPRTRLRYREARNRLSRRYEGFLKTFEGRVSDDFVPPQVLRQRKRRAHLTYTGVFSILVAWVLVHQGPFAHTPILLRAGDVSEQDILSPVTEDIEPRETAQARRDDLAKRVAPVYDYDDALIEGWLKKWERAFKQIRTEWYSGRKGSFKNPDHIQLVGERVFEITGQRLNVRDLSFLHQRSFSMEVEAAFLKLGQHLLGRLISTADLFPAHYSTGIVVREVNEALHETLVHDVSRIWSLDQAREFLRHTPVPSVTTGVEPYQKVVEAVCNAAVANLRYNSHLTQKRIDGVLGNIKPAIYSLRKDQVIVRKGEKVSEQQAEMLQSIAKLMSPASTLKRFGLRTVMLFIFFSILFRMNITRRGFRHLPLKDALFFMGMAVVTLMAVKYTFPFIRLFFMQFNINQGVEYLLPISFGGIIIHLTMGKDAALTYALLISMVGGYMLERSFQFALWGFTVSSSAIYSIKACKQRTDLYRCGAWSGAVGALMVLCFQLSQSLGFAHTEWTLMGITVTLAFASGLLSAMLTSSVIPMIESLFSYTTSMKLLELSNFNHPLLHTLMMKAPGTYHHSVIVGSLAEIAADRVKANGLLARVSSYYHDIGKMSKPQYFIENQTSEHNPHDHLQPTMSAKILFSHVKNGARLAREYNLGNKITSIIEQHHGTTLVSFFLNKAKKQEKPDLDPVNESDFRYPGPRPQSREAAIVMLADACEAATRSIGDPTPVKIQMMVHNIINRRFLEDQFDECDLTFSDLQLIEESFIRTLVSLYHHRIEYPGQAKATQQVVAIPEAELKKIQGA